jgi:hypothetical protein
MNGHQSLALFDEVLDSLFPHLTPARPLVIEDHHVVGRERRRSDSGRFLLHTHVKAAAVHQKLAQERRGGAPIMIVAA